MLSGIKKKDINKNLAKNNKINTKKEIKKQERSQEIKEELKNQIILEEETNNTKAKEIEISSKISLETEENQILETNTIIENNIKKNKIEDELNTKEEEQTQEIDILDIVQKQIEDRFNNKKIPEQNTENHNEKTTEEELSEAELEAKYKELNEIMEKGEIVYGTIGDEESNFSNYFSQEEMLENTKKAEEAEYEEMLRLKLEEENNNEEYENYIDNEEEGEDDDDEDNDDSENFRDKDKEALQGLNGVMSGEEKIAIQLTEKDKKVREGNKEKLTDNAVHAIEEEEVEMEGIIESFKKKKIKVSKKSLDLKKLRDTIDRNKSNVERYEEGLEKIESTELTK